MTFGTFVWVNANNPDPDGQLTSEKAFVALSLFNILRFPLTMLPTVITNIVQASVSVKRLRTFLKKPELDPDSVDYSPEPPSDCELSSVACAAADVPVTTCTMYIDCDVGHQTLPCSWNV